MKTFSLLRLGIARRLLPALVAVAFDSTAMRGDAVFAWNELLLHAVGASPESLAPQIEARILAMTHLAMDEAIAAVSTGRHDAATRLAVQRVAVASAAHTMLVRMLPGSARAFDALANRHLEVMAGSAEKTRAVEAGRTAAERVLARREDDHWLELSVFNPILHPAPEGFDSVAARLARGETLPPSPWLRAVPFALKSAQQFEVREVRTFNRAGEAEEDTSLTYPRMFERIDRAAVIESAERSWFERPIVIWNRIARQLCAGRTLDLPAQAQLLAMLNVVLADATLASIHWRHTVGNWRTMVAAGWQVVSGAPPRSTDIVAQLADGTGTELVRMEEQRVLIPPTPNYPSPAATMAGAAQAALSRYFKTDKIEFELPAIHRAGGAAATSELPKRSFSSVSAAARECAYVASLNSPHSREACVAGYWLGEAVGGYVSKRSLAVRR
jgi:hypothetical protein